MDEAGVRIKPDCTFCSLSQTESPPPESYSYLFFECEHSIQSLRPIAKKYNIPIPNMRTKGELILYFFPWEGYWDELRINIFYAIYKYYILMCRTMKRQGTHQSWDSWVSTGRKRDIWQRETFLKLIQKNTSKNKDAW